MKRVLKWNVPVDGMPHPIGTGTVVHVECQDPDNAVTVQVWTEEPDVLEQTHRLVRAYGTGHPIADDLTHVGSAVTASGALVWHLYGRPAS